MTVSHLGDLDAPVEETLGADVLVVLPDVVQQAAVGHQLGDQLHRGGQADPQQTTHVRVVHTGHHIGLLEGGVACGRDWGWEKWVNFLKLI